LPRARIFQFTLRKLQNCKKILVATCASCAQQLPGKFKQTKQTFIKVATYVCRAREFFSSHCVNCKIAKKY
jgi:hypothetical protein